jgi:hypothetical protein
MFFGVNHFNVNIFQQPVHIVHMESQKLSILLHNSAICDIQISEWQHMVTILQSNICILCHLLSIYPSTCADLPLYFIINKCALK